MKKTDGYGRVVYGILLCAAVVLLTGCGGDSAIRGRDYEENEADAEAQILPKDKDLSGEQTPVVTDQSGPQEKNEAETKVGRQDDQAEPVIMDADWAEYFNGLHGTAVLYDATDRQYTMYNRELALTQRSPCSTFKIVSSLIALENGVINIEDSLRNWSGEIFWNENWNRDIAFGDAFRVSCVWYFREVIDDIGKERMQRELDSLQYGNCDISDWEGKLNTNNTNRALTGFWIESSLEISPKEQVEVMERIFGEDSAYTEKSRHELKQVMLVSETEETDILMYGKTGMGKAQGIVVDAWFTGFAVSGEKTVYYCVRLGQTDGAEVSSQKAKEIAIRIVADYYGGYASVGRK